ncbi:MAG: D-alanyl-D-alanine carboxypeptidase [Chthoniobacterales bacterium]|nr:D-alanyl-D-alanine carboxypeptidase [Chthoniobacterales bacterium]
MKHLPLFLIPVLLSGCATTPPSQVMRAEAASPPVAAAPVAAPLWPANAPALQAQSAILIDARSGEVIFQKNADQPRQVASTQKLLTALIIATRGNLDAGLTVMTEDTRVEPTKLGLRPGERYTRRSLLEAIMVKSCNDACTALARDHSGSDATFASLMNQAAWSLGARHSHFLNSHGLPSPQSSTARDMARIAFAAYRQPELRRMMRVPQLAFRHSNGRMTTLKATNKLLARSPAFTGMKTGYTEAAGRCLISSGRVNGREVILVQLGSKTKNIFDDAQRIMAWSPQSSYDQPLAAYRAAERTF